MSMERALFITKASQLGYVDGGYDRLYYGNEFCERLIPSLNDLKQILSYVQKRRISLSLVTPYVTNDGLRRLEPLFEQIQNKGFACEVIVNDWGVLNRVNRRYLNLTPVLGRLLTKQKRGPRLVRLLKRRTRRRLIESPDDPGTRYLVLQKKLPLDSDPYYKGSNASSVPIIHHFLINQRIRRIELDNTLQGLFLELPQDEISASVYLPYVYITTTFFCPTAGSDQEKKSVLKIKPCKKECQRYVFKLRHRAMPKVIFLKGNTQFYKNSKLSINELRTSGIDRIVYEPEIPV